MIGSLGDVDGAVRFLSQLAKKLVEVLGFLQRRCQGKG